MIALGGEMIMRISFFNNVFGKITLGQQGIGGDGFPLNIYGIEEGDSGFDFVCPFFFVASFYRQSADFFWV